MGDFVHLHNHTQYSILDGACRIDALAKLVVEHKQHACAITDHGNLFGAVEFYDEMVSRDIHPIIGYEAYVAPNSRHDKRIEKPHYYHLTLLAENNKGLSNLIKLSSLAFEKDAFYFRPRIDDELLEEYHEGIIALSGCIKGEIPSLLLLRKDNEAKEKARFYMELFGKENFFIELQNHKLEEELLVIDRLTSLSEELGLRTVATNDAHYLHRDDYEAHDVLLCIQTGKEVDNPDRLRFNTNEIYLKSTEEMEGLFGKDSDSLRASVDIAKRCSIKFDKSYKLPSFSLPVEYGKDEDEYLKTRVLSGLRKHFEEITPDIMERMDAELGVIKKMGFAGYFLIVEDLVDNARKQGVPVGPGRGSAVGSIVSYALGITMLNPLEYNLLFERFLNPSRISMPDIDLDFGDRKRHLIIEYLIDKYGKESVAPIITFNYLKAKQALRDVSRVLRISLSDADRLAKAIPDGLNETIESALKESSDFKAMYDSNPQLKKAIDLASRLEGLVRHSSKHAAGIIITPGVLTDYIPICRSAEKVGEEWITQFDGNAAEKMGMLKMDCLGLRTLTVIEDTLKNIEKNKGIIIDIDKVSFDDEETYDLISRGETIGVFQLESSGMQGLLKRMKPDTFNDLIAAIALFRPGPMMKIDDYVERKHGSQEIRYMHPDLEPILKDCLGIMLYQEHIILIANQFGGFTMAEADNLRKAMGKKKAELMARFREQFIEGCKKIKKMTKDSAEKLWSDIEAFASYGFNKSHSAAYAVISFQTAYLKAHYPCEFWAAHLTSEIGNFEKMAGIVQEIRASGIEILPPDVNKSYTYFTVEGENIRFGLAAIKNVGIGATEQIVLARQEAGRFEGVTHLCTCLDLRAINKRVIESLIKAGGFDSTSGHRAQKVANIDSAMRIAQNIQAEKATPQVGLFDMAEEIGDKPILDTLPDIAPWDELTGLTEELSVIGFYLSGHPLTKHADILASLIPNKIVDLITLQSDARVIIGGMILEKKPYLTKNNEQMCFGKIEDLTGSIELIIRPKEYEVNKELIEPHTLVYIEGKVTRKSNSRYGGGQTDPNEAVQVLVDRVFPIEEALGNLVKSIVIRIETLGLDGVTLTKELLPQIKDCLERFGGKVPIQFRVVTEKGDEYWIRTKKLRLDPSMDAISYLNKLFGRENILLIGGRDTVSSNTNSERVFDKRKNYKH